MSIQAEVAVEEKKEVRDDRVEGGVQCVAHRPSPSEMT